MKDYVDFDIYFHLVYEHNNEDRRLSDFRGEDCTINYKGGMWKLDLLFSPEMFSSMNSLLAMIAPFGCKSSTRTFFHNVILFIDTSNYA